MIEAVSLYQRRVRALVCGGRGVVGMGGVWCGWVGWLAPYRPFLNCKIEKSILREFRR